jgi:hypothetical protein
MELSGLLGQQPEKMPDHLREMAEWAVTHAPKARR